VRPPDRVRGLRGRVPGANRRACGDETLSAASDLTAEQIAEQGREELHARLRAAFVHQAKARAGGRRLPKRELDRLVAEAAARAGGVLWRRALAQAATEALGIELAEAISHPAVERAHQIVGAPPYENPHPGPDTPAHEEPTHDAPTDDAPTDDAPQAEAPEEAPDPQAPEPQADAEEPDVRWERLHDLPEDQGDALVELTPQALRVAAVHIGGIEALRAGDRDIELRFSPAGLDVLKGSSGAAIGRLQWTEIQTVDFSRSRRGLRAGRRRVQELHVGTERGQASFELPGLTEQQLKEHLEPMLARTRGRQEES
jgi:hypothetical protein